MKAAAMGIATAETDPVCGMDVDQTKAKMAGRTSLHRGTSYFFCSDSCKKRFDAGPERFVPAAAVPPPPSPRRRRTPPSSGEVAHGPAEVEDRAAEYVREADSDLNTTAEAARGRTIFATDPVCGAEVEMTAPDALKLDHAGRTFYFVTPECRDEFLKDPARYAPPPPAVPAAREAADARDVVCGMDVDVKQAAAAGLLAKHAGRTYYFCAEDCKAKFLTEPQKYLGE
jgi:YHS domain-containing protein